VHTSYNQTITATGRLSSTNPNLQNIPIRTELGREIRKAFIADRGKVLIAADYSQIELRLAATLSKDKNMIAAFKRNKDIHAATAAAIYGIDEDKVGAEPSPAQSEFQTRVQQSRIPRLNVGVYNPRTKTTQSASEF